MSLDSQSSIVFPFALSEVEDILLPWFEKFSFAHALYIETGGEFVRAQPKHISTGSLPATCGIVLSVMYGEKLFEVSRSLATLQDVRIAQAQMDKQIEAYARTSFASAAKKTFHNADEGSREKKFFALSSVGTEFSQQEKISTAQKVLQRILSASALVVSARVSYRLVNRKEFYISSRETLAQELQYFEASFFTIFKNEAEHRSISIHDGYAKRGGFELMHPSPEFMAKHIADGEKILYAARLPAGFYDCIFSPSLAGILAHEAFGHGTEADTMRKLRAKGSQFLNKRVASPLVNLFDSPALENEAASYFFDHEGCLSKETRIVENGILKKPLTDMLSARSLGFTRTANGRREDYDHKVYARMSNTFFMPAHDTLDEMIASVQDGFFIDRATNGMEDPKGWGIQLEALYAERITNGKLTGEVFSPVIVTGYVPDILNSITMVSEQIEINGLGMCGKGHKEWVKVTDGGPYLKLQAYLG